MNEFARDDDSLRRPENGSKASNENYCPVKHCDKYHERVNKQNTNKKKKVKHSYNNNRQRNQPRGLLPSFFLSWNHPCLLANRAHGRRGGEPASKACKGAPCLFPAYLAPSCLVGTGVDSHGLLHPFHRARATRFDWRRLAAGALVNHRPASCSSCFASSPPLTHAPVTQAMAGSSSPVGCLGCMGVLAL